MLPAGERVERAEVPRAHLAGEFGRAEDVRAGGRNAVVGIGHAPLRRPADSTAVEEISPAPIETPEIVRAAEAEVREDGPSFDEEGTPLLEEGLDVAQVDDGGIHLHLPEIGIDGGVEREVAS